MQTIRANMRHALAAHGIPTVDSWSFFSASRPYAHAYAYGVIVEKAHMALRQHNNSVPRRLEPLEVLRDIADFACAFEFVRNSRNHVLLLDEILEGYANG